MTETERRAEDPRLGRWAVGLVLAFFTVDTILRAGYFYFGSRARGATPPPLDPLLGEITGSTATLVVFFLVVLPLTRRHPVTADRWRSALPIQVAGFAVFTVAKTALMWAQRSLLWPIAGLGSYEYGDLRYRFTMEAANDVFGYALLVGGVQLFDAYRRRRDRELREARLETRLHEARLSELQGRLQPHFLFNTLNTISSVMYTDPALADRLIARLSDLLRSSLAAPGRPEVSIEEELDLLSRYVDLMRARFGERLEVEVRLDAGARGASVPLFLLQPLVENAIRYAVAERASGGRVDIEVTAVGTDLVLTVEDDGPGPVEPRRVTEDRGGGDEAGGEGVGLRNTADRLALLYGDEASLLLEPGPGGGAVARVRLPLRRAGDAEGSEGIGEEGEERGERQARVGTAEVATRSDASPSPPGDVAPRAAGA